MNEVRQGQDEIQEMASGLQKKNMMLRRELRHLKRKLDGDMMPRTVRNPTMRASAGRGDMNDR